MEEVREVGPKTLWKNFQSWRTFLGTKSFSLFPGVEKIYLCQHRNQIILCSYCKHLLVYLYDL